MDYTTFTRVKQALHAKSTNSLLNDDDLFKLLVTAASRAVDMKATGAQDTSCHDYFKQETLTDQILRGQVTAQGNVVCYPRKPNVTSVTAMAYRFNPTQAWQGIDLAAIVSEGIRTEAWLTGTALLPTGRRSAVGKVFVKITYTGGFAADTANLPADFTEMVTTLTARYYREDESGLADSVGMAELTTLIYTKAWPVRVLEMMQPYIRKVGWQYIA